MHEVPSWPEDPSLLEAIVAVCADAVVGASLDGIVTRWNGAAERLFGHAHDEILGHSIRRLIPADRHAEEAQALALLLEGAAVQTRDTVRLGKDGLPRHVSLTQLAVRGTDGRIAGFCELAREGGTPQRPGLTQQLLASIVDSSGDAIVSHTLDGRITSWNPAAESMFGYRADEMIGRPIVALLPQDRRAEEAYIDERLHRGERIEPFDTQRRHKDDHLIDVSVTIAPMHGDGGGVVGASAVLRDVSAARRLAALRERSQTLETENRQTQEAVRARSVFLANMSHELRTPMNAIIGFADLLNRGSVQPASPQFKKFLGHILSSGQHLLALINDVLDLSKVEAGKFQFHSEPVDLPRLAAEVIALLRPAADGRQVRLELSVPPGIDNLMLDPSRLKKVIYNFASNAIKFSGSGGEVLVRCMAEGAHAFRIEVEDSGAGIEAQDLPRLFTEFQELHDRTGQKLPNTGIGLSLTRRLVEAQGGTVGVRSTPGVGSVFHAVLPRIVVSEHGLPPWRRLTSDRPDAPLVLVVEDNGAEQSLLVHALSAAGCAVEAVATVTQAVARCRETRFDAITLDLLLPDGSGLEALRVIRSGVLNREVPVLVISVVSEARDTLKAFPVHDVLVKPVTSARLLSSLQAAGLVETEMRRVLLIAADETLASQVGEALRQIGCEVMHRRDARSALDDLEALSPIAVVIDPAGLALGALDLIGRMRATPAGARSTVLVWGDAELAPQERSELQRTAQAVLDKRRAGLDDLVKAVAAWLPSMRIAHSEAQAEPLASAAAEPRTEPTPGKG